MIPAFSTIRITVRCGARVDVYKRQMQKWFSLAREEHGSALVEFAVTVPLLIFLLFAVLQGMFAM